MTELKYVGKHRPFGMVIDVEETLVDTMLVTNEYEKLYPGKKKLTLKKEVLKKNVNFERTYH